MGSWCPPLRPHRSRLRWAKPPPGSGAVPGGTTGAQRGQGAGVHSQGLGLSLQLWKPLARRQEQLLEDTFVWWQEVPGRLFASLSRWDKGFPCKKTIPSPRRFPEHKVEEAPGWLQRPRPRGDANGVLWGSRSRPHPHPHSHPDVPRAKQPSRAPRCGSSDGSCAPQARGGSERKDPEEPEQGGMSRESSGVPLGLGCPRCSGWPR